MTRSTTMRTATPTRTRTWRTRALVGAAAATALALAASFGQARAPINRFTIDVETVTDTKTGLVWQKVVSGQFEWNTAGLNCGEVEYGGYTDWRMPTVMELQTLIDETVLSPAVDLTVFEGTIGAPYWSATPALGNPADARYVNFATGATDSGPKSDLNFMRCVRLQ